MRAFRGGSVQVANDVIDIIIASTAYKVDEVIAVKGYDPKTGLLVRNSNKAIKTVVEDGTLSTNITIRVEMTRPVVEIVENVQCEIQKQVECMLGLVCNNINVTVTA